MTLLEKHKTYRKTTFELNQKMIKTCLDREIIMQSAKLLGLLQENTLIFDYEDEINVLMDFVLHDYRVNNKNAIEVYKEIKGWENEIEKNILDAFLSSYTSLFKITSVSETENSLILHDLLNQRENIKIMDIAFSQTAKSGLLLFFRLVSHRDFGMTSGVSFVFAGNLEAYLLRRYKKIGKKVKSDSDSIKRFVSFFKLNRTDGLEVRYFE